MKSKLMKVIVKYGLFILPVVILHVAMASNDALLAVTAASNKFAMDLYMKLIEDDKNLIVSPLGVQIVLAMVTSGAKGDTYEELENVMSYPRNMQTLHLGYQALLGLLQASELKMANNIFVENSTAILPQFYQNMVTYFTSEVENLPFLSDPGFSANRINEWAKKKTDGKIAHLIRPDDLRFAGVVLASAIHFKAKWAHQFPEYGTRYEDFFISNTKKTTVKMMNTKSYFRYGYVPKLKSKVLEMLYENNLFSMVIILPDDIEGLPKMENELHKIGISEVTNYLSDEEVIVKLPRFKINSDLDLIKPLSKLGLRSVFANSSNLTGMIQKKERPEPINLFVSNIKQNSFVEVKEDGTEAYSATVVVSTGLGRLAIAPRRPKEFFADHPFIFLITANGASSRNTLFIGRALSIKDI